MSFLYLTKKELDIFQRLVNKYAPYSTTVVFVDDYKIVTNLTVKDQTAKLEINTFIGAFYTFDDHEFGREYFNYAHFYFELAKLIYSDFNEINTFNKLEDNLLKVLQDAHDNYWSAIDNNGDEVVAKEQFRIAYVSHFKYQQSQKIFNALESGAVENQLFKDQPQFVDAILYARRKLVGYELLENVYKEEKGLPILLEDINHYSTTLYKQINAGKQLEYHLDSNKIKEIILESRLNSSSTKQRIQYSDDITVLLEDDINEFGNILFEDRYRHRFSNIELMVGDDKDSLPGRSDDVDDLIEEIEGKSKDVDIDDLELGHYDDVLEDKEEYEEYSECSIFINKDELYKRKSVQRFERPLPLTTANHMEALIIEAKQNAFLVQKRIMNKKRSQFKKRLDQGSRLDSRQLYRATIDGRIYQISKKAKKSDVVVSILIDSSFSMQGKRQKVAIESAYKLGVMFQDLRIPFCINGHSVDDDRLTEFVSYVPYNECFDKETLKEVFYLKTTGYTHEYLALKESLEEVVENKRSHQKGIVIVVSDAETENREEISDICHRYKQNYNTEVLCIAVGKLGNVDKTYENYIYLPTTTHFFQALVKEFERLSI